MTTAKLTASKLKQYVESTNTDSKFFCRANMKFSGDTMKNYGVMSTKIAIAQRDGTTAMCYELFRKQPVKMGLKASAYFCSETFKQIFPK